MTAYLDLNPPARRQWYETRRRPLTGCTVLHSTESAFDEIGEDTGAENVARFIARRDTPGSYHDLVDSDSWVHLLDYEKAAFHDGTGSNNWALSLAFACRTVDWARMAPGRRVAMLRNGARAFAAQQAWRAANGAPLTALRFITRAQSEAGESGFIEHGLRDPGRRSDPGTIPPHLFPKAEWLAACRAALEEDDMPSASEVAAAIWNYKDASQRPGEQIAKDVLSQAWTFAERAAKAAEDAAAAARDTREAVARLEARFGGETPPAA